MDHELDREIKFAPISPFEFVYERVSVVAKIETEVPNGKGGFKNEKAERTILKECSGKFSPKTVTAILGPSGSGKTTMLNLLSGRLLSENLTLRGQLSVNGKPVGTMAEYKSVVGYVMQEDLMLPTFTPAETFRFITDMRLTNISDAEKDELVNSMIDSLGLRKCADTYVGNSLIRGLSGGEKKRTSVGVELLINPSMIFLDEPTTGLDSTTALNLIKFLNRLALAGRTVVTTIHQPSSEIFLEFDHILLMLDGNIVYQNRAQDSMAYFSNLGFPVPIHSNPMDHYMKLMNKEGISLRYMDEGKEFTEEQVKSEFNELVKKLVVSYKSQEAKPIHTYSNEIKEVHGEASWFLQATLIFKRSIINELRNPLGLRAKIFQMIFFAVITIIIYERKSETLDSYIQNIGGLLFFLCMNTNFSAIFGSINIFSQERPVFIRERLSNTYVTSSYFVGRSAAYLPLEIILPLILISICYFAINLQNSGMSYFLTLACCWLASWMSSAYGLLISTAFSNPEVGVALVPILIIPLMLIGGFYASLPSIPDFYYIFQYISMFKYQFQAIVYAQFYNRKDGFTVTLKDGSTARYDGNILASPNQFYFREPYWLVMFLMGVIGFVIRIISLIALWFISNPKQIRLLAPLSSDENISESKLKSKESAKVLMHESNNALNAELGETS